MQCKICNSITEIKFKAVVLNKYTVDYFQCSNCGFLQTEKPYWLEEAYSNPINTSDTGILDRNITFSKMLAVLIYFNFNKAAKFLDYAGGYGIFTRLMRDIGFNFYWHDPYTQNLLAKGFEADIKSDFKYELITAFEVFEHFTNPKTEIGEMIKLSNTIVFSTELLPSEIPDPKNWWYYGFEHGQHISFYNKKTIYTLANQFNMNYYNLNGIHILTKRKFNNTLLVLINKLSNFGLYQIVNKLVNSKTFSDHLKIKKNN